MHLKTIAAAIAMVMLPTAANAESINVTSFNWSPGLVKGDARRFTPASNNYFARDGIGVGQLKLTGKTVPGNAPIDIYTFCIDLFSSLDNGLYTYVSGASLIPDLQRRQRIETLLAHTMPSLNSATGDNAKVISAATQLAIWELEYETTGTLDVAGGDLRFGNFQTNGESYANLNASIALSNSYLANFTNNTWQLLTGLNVRYLSGRQAQIYLVGSVPEPSTWAMMIAGFGMTGVALRRRRKTGSKAGIA